MDKETCQAMNASQSSLQDPLQYLPPRLDLICIDGFYDMVNSYRPERLNVGFRWRSTTLPGFHLGNQQDPILITYLTPFANGQSLRIHLHVPAYWY